MHENKVEGAGLCVQLVIRGWMRATLLQTGSLHHIDPAGCLDDDAF